MQTAATTRIYLKRLSKDSLVSVGAALRSLQAAGLPVQGLLLPQTRFACDCLASMHVRVMADTDFENRCTAPGCAFDVPADKCWLWSGHQAVTEVLDIWYGCSPDTARLRLDGWPPFAAQAADIYKERLIAFRVLDVRIRAKGTADMLKNARRHVLDVHGLPDGVLTGTRVENEAILGRVDPREDLTEEAVRTALEDYLAESGHIPRATVK